MFAVRVGAPRLERPKSVMQVPVAIAFAALALLTLLALVFHEPLTSRAIVIGPGGGPAYQAYSYGDGMTGGLSRARIDPAAPLDWSCELRRKFDSAFCGFGLIFGDGGAHALRVDGFSRIELDLAYIGPSNAVRVALKNHDAGYSRFGAKDFDKPLQATVAIEQGLQRVTLSAPDFIVAQWWLENARMPRQLDSPDFSNVTSLEVITGPHAQEGLHRITLERVVIYRTVIGDWTWYGSIAALWLLALMAALVRGSIEVSKWRARFTDALTRAVDHVPHMVWSSSGDGFTHYNRRWEEFTGIPRERLDLLTLVHPDDRERVKCEWQALISARAAFELEYRLRDQSNGYRWVVNKAVPEFDAAGEIVGWHGTCTEIHDRVLADKALADSLAKLRWSSENDKLTSVPNRDRFQAELQRHCREAGGGGHVCLLLVDLDHFKHVNDSFGHATGDELLRIFAQRLSASVGGSDTVGRLGGDEFAIALAGVESIEQALAIATDLWSVISAPISLGERVINVGVSIGAAFHPDHGPSIEDLFRSADAALYELKRSGRGGVKLFDASMLSSIADAARQLTLARIATRENRLVPFYQPKIDLDSGAIAGFEALLRWHSPGQPVQLPGTLDEAFCDYELAARIGEMMQTAVARDIRSWRQAGVEVGRISVNAAPAEFLRDDYAERLLERLAVEDVPTSALDVEITEYALLDQGHEYVARALSVLRQAGVSVSLDDFGTGYSSLSHLRDFAVDSIKIDRSFVQQMCLQPTIAAIVSSVIGLAGALGIDVVGEGVETEHQAHLLRAMGCRYVQGYLFGTAVPAEEVSSLRCSRQAAA